MQLTRMWHSGAANICLNFKPLQKRITNWSSSLFNLFFLLGWKGKNMPQFSFFGRKHSTACFELKQYMEVKEGDTMTTALFQEKLL